MKLLSFDVGIKNMAYCFLDISGDHITSILGLNVLDIMNDHVSIPTLCSYIDTKKKGCSCKKIAKYTTTKPNEVYCDKHAKLMSTYLIPSKQTQSTYLATKKVDELFQLSISLGMYNKDDARPKKDTMLMKLNQYYGEHCYQLITPKKANAGDIDLIELGKNMRTLFDQHSEFSEATHIIIENQISTLATRMKTIQGMLAQYFIIKNPESHIAFVSSANKLKGLVREPLENEIRPYTMTSGQRYREHKKDSVFHCSHILRQHPELEIWQSSLLTKKKDDLADCFLQGIWYIKMYCGKI